MFDIKSVLFKDGLSKKMVVFILSWLLVIFIYTWHLSSSPAGFAPAEAQTIAISANYHSLAHNAMGLPHNIFTYAVNHFYHANRELNRLVSAIFALGFIGCFFYVLKMWFGTLVAYVATAIFALTPLVLLVGRSSTSEILLLLPLALSAAYFWAHRHPERSLLGLILIGLSTLMTLYVPGGIFIVVAAAIWARPMLKQMFIKTTGAEIAAIIAAILLLMAPLIYTFYTSPAQLRPWLLVPWPHGSLVVELKHIASMAMGLFIHTTSHNGYQIGRLPLLTITQIVLAAFGLFAMWDRAKNIAWWLLGLIIFGVLAAGLNDNFTYLLYCLVGLSVLMAAGLRYLILEWRTVFPRNPLPRGLAIALVFAILAIQLLYGIRYSLVAWPNTMATRQVYVIK